MRLVKRKRKVQSAQEICESELIRAIDLRTNALGLFRRRRVRHRGPRRGALLLEASVSAALLAALLLMINQAVVRVHVQTHLLDRHYAGQQVLENLLEEFSNRDWSELDTAAIGRLSIPDDLGLILPQAQLSGEVVEQDDPVPAKRITIRLSWQEASARQSRPLQLTTWVYKRPEARR